MQAWRQCIVVENIPWPEYGGSEYDAQIIGAHVVLFAKVGYPFQVMDQIRERWRVFCVKLADRRLERRHQFFAVVGDVGVVSILAADVYELFVDIVGYQRLL